MRKAIQDGKIEKDDHALEFMQAFVACLPCLREEWMTRISSEIKFRQHLKSAYISPVSSLQWTHMVLVTHFGVAATWADAEIFNGLQSQWFVAPSCQHVLVDSQMQLIDGTKLD